MLTSLHCVALRTVRYSDSRAILTAWSAERGRVALGVPDGKGRDSVRRRALTMPLGLFEGVADVRPGREILTMRDMKASPGSPVLAAPQPARTMVQLFLAEVLERLLRESAPDPTMSEFIFGSLRCLSELRHPVAIANFHIVMLFRLSRFLGVAPDVSVPAGSSAGRMVFDFREARFRSAMPAHPLFVAGKEAEAVALLGRMSYDNMHRVRFTREERAAVLDGILSYYRLHLLPSGDLRSTDILRNLI